MYHIYHISDSTHTHTHTRTRTLFWFLEGLKKRDVVFHNTRKLMAICTRRSMVLGLACLQVWQPPQKTQFMWCFLRENRLRANERKIYTLTETQIHVRLYTFMKLGTEAEIETK